MTSPILVIADDLTGAADTGVCFTKAGLSVTLVFTPDDTLAADVLVCSTESRHAGESEARKRIRNLLDTAKGAAFIYKKIDSTLRGFPGAELAEIVNGLGDEKVLVAPAFPAQGRTTVGGMQLIEGRPIEGTTYHGEAASSDLVKMFEVCERPIYTISLNSIRTNPAEVLRVFSSPGPGLMICDAETNLDLEILSDAAIRSGISVFCGSAGLASVLAHQIPIKSRFELTTSFAKRKGPVLVIAGSRNPATAEQVSAARNAGVFVIELEPDLRFEASRPPECVIQAAAPILALGKDVILTPCPSKDSPYGPMVVAEQLAQCALYLLHAQEVGGLVLTGGDIARAVISGLASSGIQLWDELQPGIPIGTLAGGAQPDLPVITKAGGFGQKDAIIKAIRSLQDVF